MSYRRFISQYNNTARCEAQEIFDTIFALNIKNKVSDLIFFLIIDSNLNWLLYIYQHWMKVNSIHIEPFDFIQKVEFCLSRSNAF